jgi:hypothetical protein
MGRPPKPKAVLEMTGAGRKNPARLKARENEPEPTGPIGLPPAHWKKPCSIMPGAREAIWAEYVAEALPGVLGNSDRKLLEMICELTLDARHFWSGQARARAELAKLLPKLGMTPVDRARVTVHKPSGPAMGSKLAMFQGRKKAG